MTNFVSCHMYCIKRCVIVIVYCDGRVQNTEAVVQYMGLNVKCGNVFAFAHSHVDVRF